MSEIILTIGRVRRAMPRNVDVMSVCDELEKLMRKPVGRIPENPASVTPVKPKLSRAEIQKNYRLRKKSKL